MLNLIYKLLFINLLNVENNKILIYIYKYYKPFVEKIIYKLFSVFYFKKC